MDTNEKIMELENRIQALELHNKKMRRNKIITYIVTIVIIFVITLLYVNYISRISNIMPF